MGEQTKVTNPDGIWRSTLWNAVGGAVQTSDSKGTSKSWFDGSGRQTLTTTDALDNVTTNTWDGDQLVTKTIRSEGGTVVSTVSYTYDQNGNKPTTTDGVGNITTDTYDGDGRELTEVASDCDGA